MEGVSAQWVPAGVPKRAKDGAEELLNPRDRPYWARDPSSPRAAKCAGAFH
jgi:hypothetical protein